MTKRKSLVDQMKQEVKKSGNNKSKFIYFKSGSKIRIRFLVDLDEGFKIPFHDSYQQGINVPCQTLFDRECLYCEDEELRHRDLYAWPVYDYEAKEVKILMQPVNNFSPVPQLIGFYDTYGTIKDRDYMITQSGSQMTKSFSVVPMDKVVFKNKNAKPFTESKFMEILDKAFPADENEEDEEIKVPKKKKKIEQDDDNVEENWDDEDGDEESYYEEMSAKELYKLCKAKGLKVKPKAEKEYYIDRLEEYDEELESEDDEDEDEEW